MLKQIVNTADFAAVVNTSAAASPGPAALTAAGLVDISGNSYGIAGGKLANTSGSWGNAVRFNASERNQYLSVAWVYDNNLAQRGVLRLRWDPAVASNPYFGTGSGLLFVYEPNFSNPACRIVDGDGTQLNTYNRGGNYNAGIGGYQRDYPAVGDQLVSEAWALSLSDTVTLCGLTITNKTAGATLVDIYAISTASAAQSAGYAGFTLVGNAGTVSYPNPIIYGRSVVRRTATDGAGSTSTQAKYLGSSIGVEIVAETGLGGTPTRVWHASKTVGFAPSTATLISGQSGTTCTYTPPDDAVYAIKPVSTGTSGTRTGPEQLLSRRRGGVKKIAFIGDSRYSQDPSNLGNAPLKAVGYLRGLLGEGFVYDNFGLGGSKQVYVSGSGFDHWDIDGTGNAGQTIVRNLAGWGYTVVVDQVGTNDAFADAGGTTPAAVIASKRKTRDLLNASGILYILLRINPRNQQATQANWDDAKIAAINDLLPSLESTLCVVGDDTLYRALLAGSDNYADEVHFNSAGTDLCGQHIARGIFAAIVPPAATTFTAADRAMLTAIKTTTDAGRVWVRGFYDPVGDANLPLQEFAAAGLINFGAAYGETGNLPVALSTETRDNLVETIERPNGLLGTLGEAITDLPTATQISDRMERTGGPLLGIKAGLGYTGVGSDNAKAAVAGLSNSAPLNESFGSDSIAVSQ